MISLNSKHNRGTSSGFEPAVGKLVLLGTPIGNLSDLSERAIQVLASADVIAAEDTRRLRVLLSHCRIASKNIISIDSNKEVQMSSKVLDLISSGKTVVYTTDAGMPGISDPGGELIKAVVKAGLPVDAVPGPSAAILAASMSGLCEHGFSFVGFLPVKPGPRKKSLENLSSSGFAVIVFESPKRMGQTLSDVSEVYGGDHPVFVGRELTKMHQEIFFGNVAGAVERFGGDPQRGEFVMVLGANEVDESVSLGARTLELVMEALSGTGAGTRALAEELSEITGVGKNRIYNMLIQAQGKAVETSVRL